VRLKALLAIFLGLTISLSCGKSNEVIPKSIANPDYYLSQSPITDPGSFSDIYNSLPETNDELCDLIKKQLIHPLEAVEFYDIIPEERRFEDTTFLSIEAVLSGLLEYDSSGFSHNRKIENRLVLACFHHSLLFSSMLREKGIPVRIRFGFAPYIGEMVNIDVNISHIICEVWDDQQSHWICIDPDRNMVDFDADDFITGAEAWMMLRENNIDIRKFRSAFFKEEQSIIDMLRLDFAYSIRNEILYWGENGEPDIPEYHALTKFEMVTLDRIARLMKHAGSNIDSLLILKNEIAFLN